ncbi:MAG TPA: hypothetical protein VE913_12160 [Longimicrobium sp.]|nr:hypothetical protein [Longimicrobium sp.]
MRLLPAPGRAPMLDDLRTLFARTWTSFLAEAGRRDPEDEVAQLLAAMRGEMVQARADLPLHEKAHTAAIADLERERRALDDAVRRGGMAERIHDAETVRVAAEFAARHRGRVEVLEEKVKATRAEWELRRTEADEMMRRFKEAESNRFILVSELRRRGAHAHLDSAVPDDRGRMEDRVSSESAYADALGDLSDDAPLSPHAADVEHRLRELKRKLGRD